MRYPTDNSYVSSGYGWRTGLYGERNFHNGCDFPRPWGGTIYSILPGTVAINTWRVMGGWTVAIDHSDGVRAWYQHMKAQSPLRVGKPISEGGVVGIMGQTGQYVDGVHLHFETWRNGASFDPVPYLRAGVAASVDPEPLPTPTPKPEPAPEPEEEDEEMAMKGASYVRAADKKKVFLLFNEVSGYYTEHSGVDGEYNNTIARYWGTGSWAPITESHAAAIKRDLLKVRPRA